MALLLDESFYARDPAVVARELIGKRLLRRSVDGLCGGIIVETEAYLAANDPASHSFRGRTRKNRTMFGRAGLLYVYPIHARHCLNAVTETRGVASAVLIRAIEPLVGIEQMRQRRSSGDRAPEPRDLTRGPARLCEALAVDRTLDGWNLTRGSRIWIEAHDEDRIEESEIATSPRIGVTSAHDLELRFFRKGCEFVSGRRS